MTWFASVKAEIDALPREDGWLDGEGSAVTNVARFVAAAWAHALAERFGDVLAKYGAGHEGCAFPTESGGVSLEWAWPVGRQWLVTVEVDPDGSVSMCEDTRGGFAVHYAPSVEQVVLLMCRAGEAARLVRSYGHNGSVSRPPGEPPDA